MKTAIIINTGFDGGGSTTLGYEYHKLGLDVYFKDKVAYNQTRGSGDYKTYKNDKELIQILADYDKVIFSLLAIQKKHLPQAFKTVLKVSSEYPNIKICYLNCGRKLDMLYRLLELCKENKFEFDHIYSICPADKPIDNYTYMHINAYTFRQDPVESTNKFNYVLSAGRVESLKGTIRYFNNFDEPFNSDDFYYVHHGANIKFNDNGTISVPVQLLLYFDTSVKPMKPLSKYNFIDYGTDPKIDKLNIYPSYSIDDIADWSNYYCGICCILGSKSVTKVGLFDNQLYCENKAENTILNKQLSFWDSCMEYVNVEMIDIGLPVLISKMYANVLGFTDDRLIYNSFSEIPAKVAKLQDKYDEIRLSQREWLVGKQAEINENIVKKFTESV